MSEDVKGKEAWVDYKPNQQDFTAFIEDRASGMACPLCKCNHFVLAARDDKHHEIAEIGIGYAGGSFPALAAVCLNCGHILTFAKKILAEWVAAKKVING